MSHSLRIVCLLIFCTLATVTGTFVAPEARAADDKCKREIGQAVWTLIPSSDPLGRILGPSTGTLKAAITSNLTSLAPNPDGSLAATSDDSWVVGPQDVLRFAGATTFTPIADQPIGTVSVSTTLVVVAGTGQFAGATGSLHVTGTGINVFGPAAGPGSTYFDVSYVGEICRQ